MIFSFIALSIWHSLLSQFHSVLISNGQNFLLLSDRTLKVWSFDNLSDDIESPATLKAKAVVAAHDKDINSVAVAPNDSLVCSGSQVGGFSCIHYL